MRVEFFFFKEPFLKRNSLLLIPKCLNTVEYMGKQGRHLKTERSTFPPCHTFSRKGLKKFRFLCYTPTVSNFPRDCLCPCYLVTLLYLTNIFISVEKYQDVYVYDADGVLS